MKKTFAVGFLVMALTVLLGGLVTAGVQQVWKAPDSASTLKNPLEYTKASIASGNKIFQTQCFVCHGTGGKGDGPAAAAFSKTLPNFTDSEMWNQVDGELFWKITNGNAPMPTFAATIPEAERWAVVNFLRSLAPKPDKRSGE